MGSKNSLSSEFHYVFLETDGWAIIGACALKWMNTVLFRRYKNGDNNLTLNGMFFSKKRLIRGLINFGVYS